MSKIPFPTKMHDLAAFGIAACRHLKSNAIALVAREGDDLRLIGAGMGNPNRLVSVAQALAKARENGFDDLKEVVLISDAFFPFEDNIETAFESGIRYVVQPGGSIKDEQVIAKCDELGIAMAFSGVRHFNH